jgi:hypothetical protein
MSDIAAASGGHEELFSHVRHRACNSPKEQVLIVNPMTRTIVDMFPET